MESDKRNIRLVYYLLIFAVIIGGLIFWMSDLESDPPMYYSGMGQSLSTDAAQYVYHARNKILFDDFDPFDYPRWTVYQHSLTSLVSYIWFSIVGVSLKSANQVGVFLSLGGLILILAGLYKKHKNWLLLSFAILFVLNVSLITYGRLSYLENGLILLCGLLVFIYSRWGDRLWGVVLSSLAVALAMLTGKLFGALLFPALLLALFSKGGVGRWKNILTSVITFVFSFLVISVLLYGWDIFAAFSYAGEQSYGLRGFPEGLSSLTGFFEHLISYGYKNRLFYINIDLVLFLSAAAILLIYKLNRGYKLSELSPLGLLSLYWVIFVILGLMPLNYSPMRYSLFLVPAIFLFFLSVIEWNLSEPKATTASTGWVRYLFLMLVLWNALFQITALIFYPNNPPFGSITWFSLPFAFILLLIIRYLFEKDVLKVSRKGILVTLSVLLVFSFVLNIYQINDRIYFVQNKNIVEANEDLGKILGSDAVLSGPYAPVLTIDNNLKSFIHLFGVADIDSTLFDRYPVTHLALDQSNMDEAAKVYPGLLRMTPVTSYWIRDYEVRVFDVSQFFNNPEARNYRMTLYEQAIALSSREQFDSSYVLLEKFIDEQGYTKSGDMLKGSILFIKQDFNEVIKLTAEYADRYPTDFFINLHCGRILHILGFLMRDEYYLTLAQKYYEQSTIVNPYKADLANQIYQQVIQKFQDTTKSQNP